MKKCLHCERIVSFIFGKGWVVKEAGWLLRETKEYILIASGWKPKDDWIDDKFVNLHKIPKTWILKRKNLINL